MVRKLILLLIPLFFIGCASDPAPVVSVVPAEPAAVPVVVQNPKISIDLSKPDSASVSVSYSANQWAFINGVELKNGAGDVVRYTFKKPMRKVMDSGAVLEICSIVLQDYDIGGVVSAGASKLRDFVAVGDVTARPLADNEIFNYMLVDITAAN